MFHHITGVSDHVLGVLHYVLGALHYVLGALHHVGDLLRHVDGVDARGVGARCVQAGICVKAIGQNMVSLSEPRRRWGELPFIVVVVLRFDRSCIRAYV